MFKHIMVPVDLAHEARLARALAVAAELGRIWGAKVTYVGVGATSPTSLGHTPEEFAARLSAFAAAQGESHGIEAAAHAAISHDPVAELDDALLKTVDEIGADLVVMQSHIPGLMDYVWPSNGGKIAGHAHSSVMVVRG
ncbi:MAG: universal stress protein [Maritimibacter sp.]|jgi:nucleotide-binding universal stress UspA family protein